MVMGLIAARSALTNFFLRSVGVKHSTKLKSVEEPSILTSQKQRMLQYNGLVEINMLFKPVPTLVLYSGCPSSTLDMNSKSSSDSDSPSAYESLIVRILFCKTALVGKYLPWMKKSLFFKFHSL